MKKKGGFVRILSLFLSCILTCCLFSFQSDAAAIESDRIFFINQDRPAVTDTQGYIEALCVDGYGNDYVIVFFWHINGEPSGRNVEAHFYLNNVDVKPNGNEVSFYGISSSGHSRPSIIQLDGGDGINFYLDIPECKGFRFYGALDVSYIAPGLEVFNGEFLTVYNDERALYEKLYSLYEYLIDSGLSEEDINTIITNQTSIKNMISELLSYAMQEFSYIEQMALFFNSWDLYFMNLNELTSISYHVYEIWDYVTSLFTELITFPSDSESLDNFENNNKVQQDKLDEYTEESKVDKPTPEDVDYVIDSNLDLEGVADFSVNFGSITAHPYVLQMLLIVFTCALVSFILFGKRS